MRLTGGCAPQKSWKRGWNKGTTEFNKRFGHTFPDLCATDAQDRASREQAARRNEAACEDAMHRRSGETGVAKKRKREGVVVEYKRAHGPVDGGA